VATVTSYVDMGLEAVAVPVGPLPDGLALAGAALVAALGIGLAKGVRVPAEVRREAHRGLELLREGYGGKGLTEGAIRRARQLARGTPLPLRGPKGTRSVVLMDAWFARHAVDRRPGWDKDVTPGYVAHLLWGGDAAKRWVRELRRDAAR
jgi:hypothetical protein